MIKFITIIADKRVHIKKEKNEGFNSALELSIFHLLINGDMIISWSQQNSPIN